VPLTRRLMMRIRLRWLFGIPSLLGLAVGSLVLQVMDANPIAFAMLVLTVVGYNVMGFVVWKSAEQAFRDNGIEW
jgi:uncharacterized membrane protein YfcA